VRLREIYPVELPDLFAGQELVLFARYEGQGGGRDRRDGPATGRAERFAATASFPRTARRTLPAAPVGLAQARPPYASGAARGSEPVAHRRDQGDRAPLRAAERIHCVPGARAPTRWRPRRGGGASGGQRAPLGAAGGTRRGAGCGRGRCSVPGPPDARRGAGGGSGPARRRARRQGGAAEATGGSADGSSRSGKGYGSSRLPPTSPWSP
jgi:hypothetical protein